MHTILPNLKFSEVIPGILPQLPTRQNYVRRTSWEPPRKTTHGRPQLVLYVTPMDVPYWRPEDVLYQSPQDVEIWRLEHVPMHRPEDILFLSYM